MAAAFAFVPEEFASWRERVDGAPGREWVRALPALVSRLVARWNLTDGYRAFIEDLPADRRREFRDRVMQLPGDDRILRRSASVWSGRKPADGRGQVA